MRTLSFGPLDGTVPAIGQGTWLAERDPEGFVSALRLGLDLGLTHVDTAEMYGAGEAERLVGRALAGRRDEVLLVSKVLPANASRGDVVRACEASLARLGTDRLDVYLLHWRGSHPLEQTFAGFDDLLAAGKIRAFGVSNFDVPDMEEALALAGPGRIACNQVLYHPGERYVEAALLPWCRAHDVALVAYSPFGSGAFPGLHTAAGRALADVADERGATPYQVALAFLTRGEGVFAIPKAVRAVHVRENAAAAALQLAPGDIARLEAELPASRASGLPTI